MGVLDISTIKNGKVIKHNGDPYVVTWTQHIKVARGGATLKVKMKNLIDGSVLEWSYNGGDKAEEADLERSNGQYLYKDDEMAYFMDNESYEQFGIESETIEGQLKFLKEDTKVDIMYFEGKPVSITLPTKITLEVVDAPPAIKGNSQGTVNKKVTLETGAIVDAPIFIETGERIVVNTEKEEYVERAKD
jgi:elongation factor P